MKREMRFFVFIVIIIFLSFSLASASFKYNGENLVKNYVGGERIKGYINMSFDEQNANSIFRSNFNKSGIALLDLIEKNGYIEGRDFNCSNPGCNDIYKVVEEITSLEIDSNNKEYLGVKLTRNNVLLEDLSFNINSNAMPSCSPGFTIYVLGNESMKIQGNSYNDVSCGAQIKGCFDDSLNDYDNALIGRTPFCQKMELPYSPAFRIGAKVENSSTGGKLTMRMFDKGWNPLGECILPKHQQKIQELSCIVNFTNLNVEDYYVCIETDNSNNKFFIRSEARGDVCGVFGVNSENYDGDYEIFAQALEYNPSNITINTENLEKSSQQNLIEYVNEYIESKYNGNCSNDCTIPFLIDSGVSQTLSITDISVEYNAGGAILTNDKIYSIEKEDSKIDSKGLKINLEYAELYIPITPTTNELQLFLGETSILKTKINVTSGFLFDIAPKTVQFGLETKFLILSNQNITRVKWDFGNGEVKETSEGIINYIYLKAGEFNLTIEATNSKNARSVQTFKIEVVNVSQSVDKLINQTQNKINSLSRSIDSFEPWIRNELLNIENITYYQNSIDNIRLAIKNDSNQTNINLYLSEIYSLNIPKSLNYTSTGKLPIEIGFNSLDSSHIISFANSECEEENECEDYSWVDKNKINDYLIAWNSQNFESESSYKTISKYIDSGKEALLTYFNVNIKNKKEPKEQTYFIIPYPIESTKFAAEYGEIEITGDSDAIAIPIYDDSNIEFLIPGEVSPVEIGAYASPTLEYIIKDLNIEESCLDNPDLPNCQKRSGLWLYILLVIGFFILYVILQEWYKKWYESYLFPNKDDLYNIINYIYNSRNSGMRDAQIMKGLYEMKWKSEQITYAFNKIDGKRTGMWEIPIFRFFEKKKVKKEIDKRNPNSQINKVLGGNGRFFNGP